MGRIARARAAYVKNRTNARLRVYLTLKAKAGRWDSRYCSYFRVSPRVNSACKRAITRAFAAGCVPTSTTGGRHAPGSYHYSGRAVDIGVRNPSSARERARLARFHSAEFDRAVRKKIRPLELIGPHNHKAILAGRRSRVGEGSALETAHDNHVHEAY